MELATVGTLDEAIKVCDFNLSKTGLKHDYAEYFIIESLQVRMFDLKDVNQRKIRQIFRAILRTMRDVAQVWINQKRS